MTTNSHNIPSIMDDDALLQSGYEHSILSVVSRLIADRVRWRDITITWDYLSDCFHSRPLVKYCKERDDEDDV